MLKRIATLLIIIIVCVTQVASASAFNSAGSITVGTVTGKAGEIVTVNITTSNNPGIVAMRIQISYDSSRLKLINVADGEVMGSGHALFGKDYTANPFVMLWEDSLAAEDHKSNGILATLTFQIIENTLAGVSAITAVLDQASTFNVNLEDVEFSIINGSVTITSGSGETNSCTHSDSVWVVRHDPKCTSTGLKVKKCNTCGKILDTALIPATGHAFSQWMIRIPATNAKAGVEYRTCKNCSYLQTREIPRLISDSSEHKTPNSVNEATSKTNGNAESSSDLYGEIISEEFSQSSNISEEKIVDSFDDERTNNLASEDKEGVQNWQKYRVYIGIALLISSVILSTGLIWRKKRTM